MRKKTLTLALFVGGMLLLTATGVLAASPVVSNPYPILNDPTPTITPTVTITHPVAAAIASFFGLDYSVVEAWHDEGLGYGEIARAYFLAELSGESVAEVMALYERGMGWGEVAKALDLAPGNRGWNLGAIMSGRLLTDTVTLQLRGRPEVPPGWERGRGLGLGRGHGRGHNK